MAARLLVEQGHKVVLHGRNAKRSQQAKAAVPGAEACLTADLSSIQETKKLAAEVNKMGKFDAMYVSSPVAASLTRDSQADC